MHQYKYTGQVEVSVNGIGIVHPGDIVVTHLQLNHPHFVEVVKKSAEPKQKKRK